jgi:hypothetical protein
MHGVSATATHAIIAEIGVDRSRFVTVGRLGSFSGLCPQLNEKFGKVRSRRLGYGAPWLAIDPIPVELTLSAPMAFTTCRRRNPSTARIADRKNH